MPPSPSAALEQDDEAAIAESETKVNEIWGVPSADWVSDNI